MYPILLNISSIILIIWNFITLFTVKVNLDECVLIWIFNIALVLMSADRIDQFIKSIYFRSLMYGVIGVGHFLSTFILIIYQSVAAVVVLFVANIINYIADATYFGISLKNN
tara:strand:+ start:7689 stop:8024 length:336 start_codon:yes stop_codon:yes gene_type:complete